MRALTCVVKGGGDERGDGVCGPGLGRDILSLLYPKRGSGADRVPILVPPNSRKSQAAAILLLVVSSLRQRIESIPAPFPGSGSVNLDGTRGSLSLLKRLRYDNQLVCEACARPCQLSTSSPGEATAQIRLRGKGPLTLQQLNQTLASRG